MTLLLIWTLLPNLTFYPIARGFHRTFATGAACQQRTLTPPDTWLFPLWGLHLFYCWDQSLLNLSYFRLLEFPTPLGTSALLCQLMIFCFCPVCLTVCLSVCLSVCLPVENVNLRYNFWTVRYRDFIFSMHTPIMISFQMTPRSPCDLNFDLEAKNSFLDFVATGGIP